MSQPEPMTHMTLTIGFSSSAIFDLAESHQIFLNEGVAAYRDYQLEHRTDTLTPGPGFKFVRKLVNLNKMLEKIPQVDASIRIVLLSRNSPETGSRVMYSLNQHGIETASAVFNSGEPPYKYGRAFNLDLFLSANEMDVSQALANNLPAARLVSSPQREMDFRDDEPLTDTELRIAYDGDAVLFEDGPDNVFREHGLQAFVEHEQMHSQQSLEPGPFHSFAKRLYEIQNRSEHAGRLIRTALVTARGPAAEERVRTTLHEWGIWPDQAFYLSNSNKSEVLKIFNADIFFDDTKSTVDAVADITTSAHVHTKVNS